MTAERLGFACLAAVFSISSSAGAQPVLLQIKPHVGDTIAVKLQQRVEITGSPAECARRPCTTAPRRMTTVTEVFSRAIVQGMTAEGATILAVTDSIRTAMAPGSKPGAPRRVRGREGSMQLRVGSDGGAKVLDSDASDELRAIFGQMPAMLSKKSVEVGGKWSREMRIPIAGEAGAAGLVRATFTLDSLGRNGDIAYISMRGTLLHDHRDRSASELDGWMTGTMQLDRRLAWITETRAEIDVTSTYKPAGASEAMKLRTRVTQVLKAWPAK